ncbi:hypothetical protein M4J39_09235 [Pleomorphomonas sp. NRKKF1]|nr:hypothetical protein [Pleomorphomonas sp. NRK KF1]
MSLFAVSISLNNRNTVRCVLAFALLVVLVASLENGCRWDGTLHMEVPTMSILKSLKLTNAKPVRTSDNPVERARDKVISALAEQKAMAEAKIAGQHFAPTHKVWRKDADGQRVQVEAPKRLRAGWFTDASGQFFFGLRYAGKTIEFAKDKNAVTVGEFASLPGIIDKLIEAVRAGELDDQFAQASAERGQMLRKAG